MDDLKNFDEKTKAEEVAVGGSRDGGDNKPPANSSDNSNKEESVQSSGSSLIVLQWLTYAFWGWTLLALVWLLYIILASLIASQDLTAIIPYSIAATLVLLPISFLCDWFYGRKEPVKKTGAATVVMVIHAVIFALFGIGMLISTVLILVQLMIQTPTDTSVQVVWLLTFFISAILYALTFLRTLNPSQKLKINRWYPVVMAGIVGMLIVLGFVGPVAQAAITKDDRTIVSALPVLVNDIEAYVNKNSQLPASLDDISVSTGAKEIVERQLVQYKPEHDGNVSFDTETGRNSYKYQLCVDYKKEQKSQYSYRNNDDEYQTSLYITKHPAGEKCYKLMVIEPEKAHSGDPFQ